MRGPAQGVEMFNALMEHKTSSFQLKVLRNRIAKLEKEENRAKYKIQRAEIRCEELEKLQVGIILKIKFYIFH